MEQSTMMGAWSSDALVIGKGQEDAILQAEAFRRNTMWYSLDTGRFSPTAQARESFEFTHQHN